MEDERSIVSRGFGKYVESVLDRKQIKIADLVKMLGFEDVAKGTEKIYLLLRFGLATYSLVDNLRALLDLDPVESHTLIETDKERIARESKDYGSKHSIHRDGTPFHAITGNRPADFRVEKLKDDIDIIREEMKPGGRYAVSFPAGYAAAGLEARLSYLNQIERDDFPPGTSGRYRRKIACIREGKNPEELDTASANQPIAVLECIIEEISKNPSQFFRDLISGIKERKQDSTIELLHQGNELGGTAVAVALYLGAKYRYEEVVTYILTRVTDIDARHFSDALHAATEYGYPEIVAQLLAGGANPNAPVEFGRTPLMTACRRNRPVTTKLVETLLRDRRTHVNQTDEWGRSALHWAAFRHQPTEILSMLVDAGADPGTTDVDGDTPLHKGLCNYDCTKYLLEAGSDVNVKDRFGMTPLLRVLSWGTEGETSIVRLLLDHGADLNVANDLGENSWTIAGKWNRVSRRIDNRDELLAILNEYSQERGVATAIGLHSGVAITAGAVEQRLHEAPETDIFEGIAGLSKEELSKEFIRSIKGKNENKALRLLEAGADPNMREWRDNRSDSALYLAVKWGCSQVVSELLARGADPEHTERHAGLYVAAKNGYPTIVKALLESGASVNWVDHDGETPLMAACCHKSPFTKEVIGLLLEDPAIGINAEDHRGRTALHYAAFWFQPVEVISLLLLAGADVNKADDEGNTPVHEAIHDYDVAKFLVDSGADVNARNKFGFTPLMKAINMGVKGKMAVVKLLVERGTDLAAQSDKGESAYSIARKRKNFDKVIAILDKYAVKGANPPDPNTE